MGRVWWTAVRKSFLIGAAGMLLVWTAGANTPPGDRDGSINDPVSTASGEYYDEIQDIFLPGPLPLTFVRYYCTTLRTQGQVISKLGNNWMHNYDLRLVLQESTAKVVFLRGQVFEFSKVGATWQLSSSEPLAHQLVQAQATFRFLDLHSNLIYTFNSAQSGRLERIEDRNGNALTLSYPVSTGVLSQVADDLGRRLEFVYDQGRLVRVSDSTGRSVNFGYAGSNLQGASDVAGRSTLYDYLLTGDHVGLLNFATLPRSNVPYRQVYDEKGRAISQTDSAGNQTALAYNTPSNGQTQVTNALQGVALFRHLTGNLTEHINEAGNVLQASYDGRNRRTSLKDRLGNETTYTYHEPSGLLESVTSSEGSKTTYAYTATTVQDLTFYDLTQVTYADGTSETFEHDSAGNVVARTDRAGGKWMSSYNARGQLVAATLPTAQTVTWTYNADGTLASLQLPGQGATTFSYDGMKRVIKRTHQDGSFLAFEYDNRGNLLAVTDERGIRRSWDPDLNGLPQRVTDADGSTVSFTLTGTEQLAKITDRAGKVTSFGYDPLDRIQSITYPNAVSETLGYDATGNLISFKDADLKVWQQEFDKNGALLSFTNPLGDKLQLARDAAGRVTSASSALGNKWTFSYDGAGRLASVVDPLSGQTQIAYNSLGLASSITLAGSVSASYTRDSLGRITSIKDPRGNLWEQTYDESGRLSSNTDPLGRRQTYTRDVRGRITKVTFPEGSVQVSRDSTGKILGRAYSDGTVLQYVYDTRGFLKSGTNFAFEYGPRGAMTVSNGLSVTRDDKGRVVQLTLAPGRSISYLYDVRDHLLEVTDWVGGTTRFFYDTAGRVLRITRPNGVVTRMTYDGEGRIASLSEETGSTLASSLISRDSLGRVVKAVRNVPLTPTLAQLSALQGTFAYDAAYQIVGFGYDGLGRRTRDTSRTYTWDLGSRLRSVAEGDETVQLAYDAIGLPVAETVQGTTRDFVWNYAFRLPCLTVIRQGAADRRYYVFTPEGELLHSIEASDGARHYYHYDEAGNTLFLTSDVGQITDSYAYSPEGLVLNSVGSLDNPFTFSGRYGVVRIHHSSLYLVRLRVYDSLTGSYLSRNPVMTLHPASFNPYQLMTDGLQPFPDVTGEGHGQPTGRAHSSIFGLEAHSFAGHWLGNAGLEVRAFQRFGDSVELRSGREVPQGFRVLEDIERFRQPKSFTELLSGTGVSGETVSLFLRGDTPGYAFFFDRQAIAEVPGEVDQAASLYRRAADRVAEALKDKRIGQRQRDRLLQNTQRRLQMTWPSAERHEEIRLWLSPLPGGGGLPESTTTLPLGSDSP
ncbi:MAG: DUF6531 domain-containing protein [Acidobacteriota bacterium]